MKKKILLHICCAPCSAAAVLMLKDDYDISFYWYNPNIYDREEYGKRRDAAVEYAKELGVSFFEEKDFDYDYAAWKNNSDENCGNCYKLRLGKTSEFASNNGFDFFSTSLLSSPYQKHEIIKETAKKQASEKNVQFFYQDFRPKFYEGKNALRRAGYYIQKYCACAKSYKERFGENENK